MGIAQTAEKNTSHALTALCDPFETRAFRRLYFLPSCISRLKYTFCFVHVAVQSPRRLLALTSQQSHQALSRRTPACFTVTSRR